MYTKGKGKVILMAYVDADFAQCKETRKSVTGYVVKLGECTIAWKSRKQAVVSLSSAEAEYIALSEVTRIVVWLRGILKEIGFEQEEPTVIYEDNNSCIFMAENEENSERSKHIDVKYHYIREQILKKQVKLIRIETENNLADMFTKAIKRDKFIRFRGELGLKESTDIQLGGVSSQLNTIDLR